MSSQYTPEERWLPIAGYENLYEVSSFGNVKRIVSYRSPHPHILKPYPNVHGYLQVSLSNNGLVKKLYIHRLVAEAFIGIPKGLEINHLDTNRANNHLSNLEVTTHKANVEYTVSLMRHTYGENHPFAQFSDADIYAIVEMWNQGYSAAQIGIKYNAQRNLIRGIIKQRSWKHLKTEPLKSEKRNSSEMLIPLNNLQSIWEYLKSITVETNEMPLYKILCIRFNKTDSGIRRILQRLEVIGSIKRFDRQFELIEYPTEELVTKWYLKKLLL